MFKGKGHPISQCGLESTTLVSILLRRIIELLSSLTIPTTTRKINKTTSPWLNWQPKFASPMIYDTFAYLRLTWKSKAKCPGSSVFSFLSVYSLSFRSSLEFLFLSARFWSDLLRVRIERTALRAQFARLETKWMQRELPYETQDQSYQFSNMRWLQGREEGLVPGESGRAWWCHLVWLFFYFNRAIQVDHSWWKLSTANGTASALCHSVWDVPGPTLLVFIHESQIT